MNMRSDGKIEREEERIKKRADRYGANWDGAKSKRRMPHRFANDAARNSFGKEFLARLSRQFDLKGVTDCPVKSTTLSKLRRAHADAAAITDFVDFVEQVDDIEPDRDGGLVRNLYLALQTEIKCFVGMKFHGVGKAPPQAVAIESVDGRFPIVPRVGRAGRPGKALVVIEEDPIFLDVSQLIRIEKELRRANLRSTRPFISKV